MTFPVTPVLSMKICLKNWSLSRSFREASGGPFRAMGPAATAVGARSLFLYFLIRQEIGERIDPRRSPLGNPRRQGQTARDRALDWQLACGRLATGSLAAATGLCAVSLPRSGCRRRRDGGGSCRSCPKRGGNCPTAAHEVKRRPRVFVRALDGAEGHVTRAGFQRAGPFGCSCILLAGQKYAPGGTISQRPR